MRPSQTSIRPNITFAPTFAKAFNVVPSRSRLIVSFPKAEKVVNRPESRSEQKLSTQTSMPCVLRQVVKKTDYKAANQVDGKCAIWKVNAFADDLGPCGKDMAKYGAKCSTKGNDDHGINRRHGEFSGTAAVISVVLKLAIKSIRVAVGIFQLQRGMGDVVTMRDKLSDSTLDFSTCAHRDILRQNMC